MTAVAEAPVSRRERAEDALGFRLPATSGDWSVGLMWVFVGQLVGIAWLMIAGYFVDAPLGQGGAYAEGYAPVGWFATTLTALQAGIWEEVLWRGALLAPFLLAAGRWPQYRVGLTVFAVLASSMSFAWLHQIGYAFPIVQVGFAFIMGVFFCISRLRAGSIWPAVLVHIWIDLV